MPSLEVLHPGLLTTIQDTGRNGYNFYAIPNSGVMDPKAAKIALMLLDLPESYSLIECTSLAPTLRFHHTTRIVLTGADFGWEINGKAVALNTVIEIAHGDVLKGGNARDKLRGYIAVEGVILVESVYGSSSTDLNAKMGGIAGRVIKKGDVLEWSKLMPASEIPRIPVYPGPEFDWLSEESQIAISKNVYSVGMDSNRMGARLVGPQIEAQGFQLPDSVPVLPGFVQLPPGGVPIVVLQDGQVTGGYPRVLYIPERELGRFNQLRLKAEFRFLWNSPPFGKGVD